MEPETLTKEWFVKIWEKYQDLYLPPQPIVLHPDEYKEYVQMMKETLKIKDNNE